MLYVSDDEVIVTPINKYLEILAARQSTSVLICPGLACSPACVRAICFDSFISGNRNFSVNV
jgi:hypothetical protein